MKIKELRIRHGLSQEELAKIANTSQRTISSYESSAPTQNVEALIKLADYFHTTIDSLVGRDVPYLLDRGLLTNEQNYIIDKIKELSPQDCERVDAFISGLIQGKQQQDYIKWKFMGGQNNDQ